MRVTARSAQDTRVIDVGAPPSAPETVAVPDARPPQPRAVGAEPPWMPSRGPRLIWAAVAVVSVVGGSLFLVVDALRGPTSQPTGSPPPTDTVSPSTGVSGTPTPTGSVSGTPSDTAVPSQTPSLPSTTPTPEPGADTGPSVLLVSLLVVAAVLVLALLLWLLLVRRRRSTPVRGWQPVRRPDNAALPAEDRPRASLGTPDVLVLTPATTEEDPRLRDHLAQEKSAVFANLQLACSFRPAEDWIFKGAKLTVVLARADGKAAPAPIAYSLRPLSELDGTAQENSVEIGADVKFINAKAAREVDPRRQDVRARIRASGVDLLLGVHADPGAAARGLVLALAHREGTVGDGSGDHVVAARARLAAALVAGCQPSRRGCRNRRDRAAPQGRTAVPR